ncbi:unnamed protein product [Protopolystoma xenopodis]|uniref:Uncharacterized protein n=1 Tax=Protopolystoma xenopodis TaxID=117903 RepID=A0A3S5BF37_9PLAT|nr:unnamed protein product [Protopolystoma xenopodis]
MRSLWTDLSLVSEEKMVRNFKSCLPQADKSSVKGRLEIASAGSTFFIKCYRLREISRRDKFVAMARQVAPSSLRPSGSGAKVPRVDEGVPDWRPSETVDGTTPRGEYS